MLTIEIEGEFPSELNEKDKDLVLESLQKIIDCCEIQDISIDITVIFKEQLEKYKFSSIEFKR